jgi:subtilase family serine protease
VIFSPPTSFSVITHAVASPEIFPDSMVVASNSTLPVCSPFSLCPDQLGNGYGFNTLFGSGVVGSGQTIVIVDACGDPTLASDLETFDAQFGLSPPPNLNVTIIGGSPCTDPGWSGETSLDVEWAHVAAPGAAIQVLIGATPDPQDMYAAWTFALNHHLGNQISNSFGGAGCYNPACDDQIGQGIGSCNSVLGTEGVNVGKILTEAERENVTVLAGSGDTGAFGLGTTQIEDIPADCQGVLTVGGTSLFVDNAGNYEEEIVWNGSSGGGYTTNREPAYQAQAGIFDPYNSLGKPDVSAVADPSTGVQVFNNGTWNVIGGTSLSCPLWAGFIADVNQIRAEKELPPAGFVNPFLYETVYGTDGSSPLYPQDFHDIILGNNDHWSAGPGWDATTGLGTFIVPALAETLGTNAGA